MKFCILSALLALVCGSAFAEGPARKVASVDLNNEVAVKAKAIDVSKAYVGKPQYGKIKSWNVDSIKKETKNTVVSLTYVWQGKKKDEQGQCYVTVTFTPPDENDGKRMGGTALVEEGMCSS